MTGPLRPTYTARVRRYRVSVAGLAVTVAAGFAAGAITVSAQQSAPQPSSTEAALSVDEVVALIEQRAARALDPSALAEGAIGGLLNALGDPWSEYASQADIAATDTAVAGDTDEPLYVQAEFLADGTRVVRIDSFAPGVAEQVRNALTGEKSGVLLDLRGNAGGLIEEAVAVASEFLSGGVVLSYTARGAQPTIYEAALGGDTQTPLVVLVDVTTASSAEILAGALKERGRAVVVGQRTFGKGSVQEQFTLSDGSRLRLTVGYYRLPSGGQVEGVGVSPDVEVLTDDIREAGLRVLAGLVGTP